MLWFVFTDYDDCKRCCESSYTYELYLECVYWCQKLERYCRCAESKELLRYKVLKAKVLFNLYKREQAKLKASALHMGKEFSELHNQCYSKTKEVISTLGVAFDDGLLKNDGEGMYMLDIAMMDYIFATNKLNDLKRCYLCQKRLSTASVKAEVIGNGAHVSATSSPSTNNGDNTACGKISLPWNKDVPKHSKTKLIHSHLIPKSILDRFTQALPAPKNLKIFAASHTGTLLEIDKGKVYSPKPLGRDMCCWNCENILSSKGESTFMKMFFNTVYNLADPQSSKKEHFIEYGPWLYHFCAGLLFRNILLPPITFLNENEIYQLLQQYRNCILNLEVLDETECPDIYVLFTPLTAEENELKYGVMNRVLSSTLEWHFGRFNLDSGKADATSSFKAHFFLIHIGQFNVLVKLSPSANCQIDERFRIQAKGGLYHVLPEEDRKKFIPLGMWELLRDEAKHHEQELLEKSSDSRQEIEISPGIVQTKAMDTFKMIDGIFKELSLSEQNIQQRISPDKPKTLNYLPSEFQIHSHSTNKLFLLPQCHSVIAHHTFVFDETNSEETVFVCIEKRDGFNLCKPYVIWHYFVPGLEFSIGFFLNQQSLSLEEPLNDAKALHTFQSKESLTATKHKISAVLPKLLLSKGIVNFGSFVKRLNHIRYQYCMYSMFCYQRIVNVCVSVLL